MKATGKGVYTGTVKTTFKIVPTKTKLISVKSTRPRQMTVKWKKNTTGSRYQIQYSPNIKFKSGVKSVVIRNNKTTSRVIKHLKRGKIYYVRIRSYKTVSGKKKNYFGAWSNIKAVKIK